MQQRVKIADWRFLLLMIILVTVLAMCVFSSDLIDGERPPPDIAHYYDQVIPDDPSDNSANIGAPFEDEEQVAEVNAGGDGSQYFGETPWYPAVNAGNEPERRTYVYVLGRQLVSSSSDAPGVDYYYIQDHLGSNRVIIGNDEIEWGASYYAFGEERELNEDTYSTPYRYTGKELDDETGLYFYGARYYNPEIGRFMQPDRVLGAFEEPLTLNRYAYVTNNPLKYIDPTGHQNSPSDTLLTSKANEIGAKALHPDSLALPSTSPGSPTVKDFLDQAFITRGHSPSGDRGSSGTTIVVDGRTSPATFKHYDPGTIVIDSTYADKANYRGFGTVVHELTHNMDDAKGMTDQDYIKVHDDFLQGADQSEKDFLEQVCEGYLGAGTKSANTPADKATVGREIIPLINGKIAEGEYVTKRMKTDFSTLSDKFKNSVRERMRLKEMWKKIWDIAKKEQRDEQKKQQQQQQSGSSTGGGP